MLNDNVVVALEEHYWDKEIAEHFAGREKPRSEAQLAKLYDFGDLRLGAMDKAGVDIQVISHGAPSGQCLAGPGAADVAKRANDRLAENVSRHPDRFAAFGALPTFVPDAAADELERMVRQLGFKGAMIHGNTNGEFLDEEKFWPIFERAEALDVPIYLHPSRPVKEVSDIYYNKYADNFPMVVRAAWGFTVETATTVIRLILSGMFKKHPRAKIILGHLGETLPFLLWRVNQALSRPGHDSVDFRGTFCNNFWITSSGNFSTPALLCCMQEMGMDRIMFSIDWPFVENEPAIEWARTLQLSPEDMTKFMSGNAKQLLKL